MEQEEKGNLWYGTNICDKIIKIPAINKPWRRMARAKWFLEHKERVNSQRINHQKFRRHLEGGCI